MKLLFAGAVLACLLPSCRPSPSNGGPRRDGSAADSSSKVQTLEGRGPQWEAGRQYLYSLNSTARVDFGNGTSAVSYELVGTLETSVVERQASQDTLYLQLREARVKNLLSNSNPDLDRLAAELPGVGCVLVLREGLMAEFGVSKSASNGAIATYRQIASSLQTSVPPTGSSWQAEEYDGTGRYLARYQIDDAKSGCAKKKLQYLALLSQPVGPDGKPFDLAPQVLKSIGRIGWTPEHHLDIVDIEEDVVVKGAQLPVQSSTHLVLKLAAVETIRAPVEVAARTAEIALTAASKPLGGKASLESLDRARTRGKTFTQILAEIDKARASLEKHGSPARATGKGKKVDQRQSLLAKETESAVDSTLFNSLVASLRSDANAVEQAVQMIKSKSPIAPLLIDALSSASNDGSEKALLGLLDHNRQKSDENVQVLYALARTQRPSDTSIATMKSVLASDPFNVTALYALGSYSRRFRDDGETQRAAALGEYLVQKLSVAEGRTDTTTALRALQNSGDAKAVPAIRKYLNDPDKSIMAAAFRALGPMNVDGVDELLALRLKSDASSDTKLLMIEVAGARNPSDVLAAALASASTLPDPNVRYRAVEVLAKWLGRDASLRSGLAPFLEKSSKTDPEPRIRALARAAL